MGSEFGLLLGGLGFASVGAAGLGNEGFDLGEHSGLPFVEGDDLVEFVAA